MLDLVLTNIPERVIEVSEGGRLGQSDHEMIQIKVSDGQGVPTSGKEVKNWRRADWQRMRICEGHPSHAPSVRILIFKLIEKTTWTMSTSILFGFNTYNSGPKMHGKTLI